MSAIMPTLAPSASMVNMFSDTGHTAAFKAMISRRSQRGRELHDHFDRIIAVFKARDDFLISHIHLLKQTLLDHNIRIPVPGSTPASRHNTTPVSRKRDRSGVNEDVRERSKSSKRRQLSTGIPQAPEPSSKERRRLAREIVYSDRHPNSIDVEMASDEMPENEVRDIHLMKAQGVSGKAREDKPPSDTTGSEDSIKYGQHNRKRMSGGLTPPSKRRQLSHLSRSTESSISSSSSSSGERPIPNRRYRLWDKSSPLNSKKSRMMFRVHSSATSSAPSSTPFSLLSDASSDSTYQSTEMSDHSFETHRRSPKSISSSESELLDRSFGDVDYQADLESEPGSRGGYITGRMVAAGPSPKIGTAFQQHGPEARVQILRSDRYGAESEALFKHDPLSGMQAVGDKHVQPADVEQGVLVPQLERQSETDDSHVKSKPLSRQHDSKDSSTLTHVKSEPLYENKEAISIKREPLDIESEVSRDAKFETFEDPLRTPPSNPTSYHEGASSSASRAELENEENNAPQNTTGDRRSAGSRAARSRPRPGPSQVEHIDPELLRTFYQPRSPSAGRKRNDTFHEAWEDSEGGDTEINDPGVNETEDSFADPNDPEAGEAEPHDTDRNGSDLTITSVEVKVEAEPHDTERNGSGLTITSVEVKVEAEVEECRFGSPTQSEIARVAPDHRAQIDIFVRGWARGVAAHARGIETRAEPTLLAGTGINADNESAAASSPSRPTLYDSVEVTPPVTGIEKPLKVARNALRQLAAAPQFRYVSVSDPDYLHHESVGDDSASDLDLNVEDASEDETEKRATVTGNPTGNQARVPRFRYVSVSDPDELPHGSPTGESGFDSNVGSEQAEYRHINSEDEAWFQAEYETVHKNDEEEIGTYWHTDSEYSE